MYLIKKAERGEWHKYTFYSAVNFNHCGELYAKFYTPL